ncbi:CBR-DHS-17 protein [Ditylenchus destructor]|nr:CBR-DHS-17 protein [Ditylenchus destructor]
MDFHHNFFDDLMCEKSFYDKFAQYSRTKLMNHLATFYIHRLLFKHGKQFQVTANVVDADQKTDRRVSRTYNNHFNALSASESHLNAHANGIQTLARLVENPEFATVSGKYFDANGKEIRKSADAGDVRLQNRLWEASKQLCNGILFPENSNSIETNGHTNSIQTNSIPVVLNNVH